MTKAIVKTHAAQRGKNKGQQVVCTATVRECPLGEDSSHMFFDNMEQVEEYNELENARKYGEKSEFLEKHYVRLNSLLATSAKNEEKIIAEKRRKEAIENPPKDTRPIDEWYQRAGEEMKERFDLFDEAIKNGNPVTFDYINSDRLLPGKSHWSNIVLSGFNRENGLYVAIRRGRVFYFRPSSMYNIKVEPSKDDKVSTLDEAVKNNAPVNFTYINRYGKRSQWRNVRFDREANGFYLGSNRSGGKLFNFKPERMENLSFS